VRSFLQIRIAPKGENLKQPIRTVFVVMACLVFVAGLLKGALLGSGGVGLAAAVLRGQASAAPAPFLAPAGMSIDLANAKTRRALAEVPNTPAMVSAVCPNCHILLVEASNASLSNLTAAVTEAAALGATEISNSYGGPEFSGETAFGATFDHPAIAIPASSGDSGFATLYPASSQFVTAMGGTSLVRASNARGWAETAWSGAGSGCSAFESQPAWQATNANVTSVCGRRAVADVSTVADPNRGVSVYDSFAFHGSSGWLVFGGTSVAAPIVASVFALAGGVTASSASYPYGHSSSLFDVVSGSNVSCGTLLCQAGAGWDGPTGLGPPDGPGGF
jgi:hypothetical protein